MFTVERRVGRLVEARIFELGAPAEVEAYLAAFTPALFAGRPVLCADHRPVVIYKPEVADRLITMFKNLNARWERVAIVVAPTNATLAMQLQRIVRESSNPSRRVFLNGAEAGAFLGEILDPAERGRLTSFIEQQAVPSSARRRS